MTETILWFALGFNTVMHLKFLNALVKRRIRIMELETSLKEAEKRTDALDDIVETRDHQLRIIRVLNDTPGAKELICEMVAVRKRKGLEYVMDEAMKAWFAKRGKR